MRRARRSRTWIAVGVTGTLMVTACTPDRPSSSSNPSDTRPADTSTPSEPSDSIPATSDPTSSTTAPPETSAPTPTTQPPTRGADDRAYYVLPPGNYGGIPTNEHSLDQLPLYDGLTPLRGDVSDEDLDEFFLPADLQPIGETTPEPIDRPGTTVEYDEWGIPHVTGETREDVAFGAGWATARDRSLLIEFGRGAARVAVADVPGIDAFSLVTSGQTFVPSAATEQLVTDQVELIRETFDDEGEEILADAAAYAEGMTAYFESIGSDDVFTVNDVIAVTALIGSIFGAGGGAEAENAEYLAQLRETLPADVAEAVWNDTMRMDDPEAPTTLEQRFNYPVIVGDGEVTGSVELDAGSITPFDPREQASPFESAGAFYDATDKPPTRLASNWLLVDPSQSASGASLGVMGPQLGYYYPEIVQQIHLKGPDIDAQGIAVPGLAMYLLIGMTADYAWSLTSASMDVRDVFAEILCEPDGSDPSLESTYYEFNGECVPFETFDAGTLGDQQITYPTSVHGPVIGTATSAGRPIALTRQRSTFGRDGLNLAALKDLTEGDARNAESFYRSANKFGFTFNWGYVNRDGFAYFASGRLPARAIGVDRRLPTLGTGEYEWRAFRGRNDHPHGESHSSGRLVNWNNQSAPGFVHDDGSAYGSNHRVELFDEWPEPLGLAGVVSVMNRAATTDVRAPIWKVVSRALDAGEAPSELAASVAQTLDEWAADDAPYLDADEDGFWDHPGPLIMDALWGPMVDAVRRPVMGDLALSTQGVDQGSFLDKDLRTVLGEEVEGPYELQYCGQGDLEACAAALWGAVDAVASIAATEYGDDPSQWQGEASRVDFAPGLIPETIRPTNRPTYQQLVELAPR